MNAIININPVPQNAPVRQVTELRSSTTADSGLVAESGLERDTVEISQTGRMLADLAVESSFDLAKMRAIRSAIQNGTYETGERINAAVNRLLDALS